MVKYICFCQMTTDFLRLPLEERNKWTTDGLEIARKQARAMRETGKIRLTI